MIYADATKSKTTLVFSMMGTTCGHHARGWGHMCEHVMGLGGSKTHTGLCVHIHPNMCV